MKGILKDVAFGLLAILAVTLLEILVTIPLGSLGDGNPEEIAAYIRMELLLTSIPAGLVTCGLAWLTKPKTKRDAMQKSITWAAMLLLNYVAIGLGNGTMGYVLASVGFYTLLACGFAGPMLYQWKKRLL